MKTLWEIGGDAGGRAVIAPDDRSFLSASRPWTVRLRYVNRWIASLSPGFVNGVDPTFLGKGLTESPDIPLTAWCDPGGDAGNVPPWIIPPFFTAMGCVPPPSDNATVTGDSVTVTVSAPQPSDARDILRSQIWLSQARPTFKVAVDLPSNLVLGDLVDYSVTYDLGMLLSQGARPVVRQGSGMPSPQKSTLEERMAGAYGDDGHDTLLLATIYYVSLPRNNGFYSPALNDTWTPYVVRNCFWNLSYSVKNPVPVNLRIDPIAPSLAFFAGQYVTIAGFLGSRSALMSQIVESVFNANDNTGTFWTI